MNANNTFTVKPFNGKSTAGFKDVTVPGPEWDPRPRYKQEIVGVPADTCVTLVEWVCGPNGHSQKFAKVRLPNGVECVVATSDLVSDSAQADYRNWISNHQVS
jgi:hypothetical protein